MMLIGRSQRTVKEDEEMSSWSSSPPPPPPPPKTHKAAKPSTSTYHTTTEDGEEEQETPPDYACITHIRMQALKKSLELPPPLVTLKYALNAMMERIFKGFRSSYM